ncbi:MAG: class I SAM-dependent methyltransferase [Bacteroidetes bacterium]|nr:class I SAM-dependent methyltransferase [Bacteroidota bacterium]
MYKYREIFYKQYYTNQAGKADPSLFKNTFEEQKWNFTNEIVCHFPKNKDLRILDIGSGIGSLIQAAKDAGYKNIRGIDISTEQVETALKLGVKEVEEGNLDKIFENNEDKYDIICGMDIIEHFSKDELVDILIKLKNKLNNSGMLIFRTPNSDAPLSSVFAKGDFTHECHLNKSSALQLMKSCGFSDVEVLPSMLKLRNPIKELLRKFLWFGVNFCLKIILFSTARTWHQVLFTPNLIIISVKQ